MPEAPTFDLEATFPGLIAGIDEAGRGTWAGPVVASAVILNRNCTPAGLRDSKTLTAKRRDELAASLWKCARIGVGIATVDEIDQLNILKATYLAMQRAAATLPVRPKTVLVDGKYAPRFPCQAYPVIKGDTKSLSIAAASIIAKTTRDRMMLELSRHWPGYGWDANKGYGARAHQDGLNAQGITPHHRRTFAPIRSLLGANEARLAV